MQVDIPCDIPTFLMQDQRLSGEKQQSSDCADIMLLFYPFDGRLMGKEVL